MEIWRKDLAQIIANNCKEKQIAASNDFVAFLLSLLLLDPDYSEESIDATRVIETITNLLVHRCRPRLVSFKIQLHFLKNYQKREERIKKYRRRLRQKTEPLIKEICDAKNLGSDRDYQKLYQKMLVVMTLLSGLGKPTEPSILRQVELALQSVYQPTELSFFVNLSHREKEEQLIELTCIVAGIRLFNKDCQRGGEGIDDVPNILQEAVVKTQDFILGVLEELMRKIYKFTAVVENASGVPEEGNGNERISWAIEMLASYRQQEMYIRKVLGDVGTSKSEIKRLLNRLRDQFAKLHETCRFRTAIPTSRVYPQFVNLATTWLNLQDEVMVLSHVNSFLSQLQTLCVTINAYDDSAIDDILGDIEAPTDAERLESSMGKLITDCGECDVLYPNSTQDFDKINFEYVGFCAWTLVSGKGALVPGNPNIGVAKWKGKHFAFSSSEAARIFGQDPSGYLHGALDFVRKNPEYVHLFQMYDEIRQWSKSSSFEDEEPVVRRDQEIQTQVHALPSFVDKNYSSSIWEHKKRALHLTKISRCSTKSTQTTNSQFRSKARIQVEPPRNKQVQTRKDGSTSTGKLLNYISGLWEKCDDCELNNQLESQNCWDEETKKVFD